MGKLKNGFNRDPIQIEIECDKKTANKNKSITTTFSSDKYKSISLKKSEGDWPDEMLISWDKGDFDFIFMENIRHKKKNKVIKFKFKFKKSICKKINPKEIDDFEIQIKSTSAKEIEQGIGTYNDPDTTVTIGEAQPGIPPHEKKKKV